MSPQCQSRCANWALRMRGRVYLVWCCWTGRFHGLSRLLVVFKGFSKIYSGDISGYLDIVLLGVFNTFYKNFHWPLLTNVHEEKNPVSVISYTSSISRSASGTCRGRYSFIRDTSARLGYKVVLVSKASHLIPYYQGLHARTKVNETVLHHKLWLYD